MKDNFVCHRCVIGDPATITLGDLSPKTADLLVFLGQKRNTTVSGLIREFKHAHRTRPNQGEKYGERVVEACLK